MGELLKGLQPQPLEAEDIRPFRHPEPPQTLSALALFGIIVAAILTANLISFYVAQTYTDTKIAELQQAMHAEAAKSQEAAQRANEVLQGQALQMELNTRQQTQTVNECLSWKRIYQQQSDPMTHASMAQACAKAGMAY